MINFDNDNEWVLNDMSKSLHDYSIGNETEISYFNYEEYCTFKLNPVNKW